MNADRLLAWSLRHCPVLPGTLDQRPLPAGCRQHPERGRSYQGRGDQFTLRGRGSSEFHLHRHGVRCVPPGCPGEARVQGGADRRLAARVAIPAVLHSVRVPPTLSDLYRYPVKSCRGERLTAGRVEPWGLAGDRRWMIVDADGGAVTARECPRLGPASPPLNG